MVELLITVVNFVLLAAKIGWDEYKEYARRTPSKKDDAFVDAVETVWRDERASQGNGQGGGNAGA